MISTKRINLKDKETGFFVQSISIEEITLDPSRKYAKNFKWYSWFYYKVLINVVYNRIVDRSTIIEIIGG